MTMRRLIGCCAAIGFCVIAGNVTAVDLPKGGVNLLGLNYWNAASPFNDVARMGNRWISYPEGGGAWDDQRDIPLTAEGYPASLLGDQNARTLIFTHNNSIYPTGDYQLSWEGTGTLQIDGATQVHSAAGQATYQVSVPNGGGLFLSVTDTSPSDPIRNIRMARPGTAPAQNPFYSDYAADLQNYGVLRYMDWNATNNQTKSDWSERTTLDTFHWGGEAGVPYELQIAYSNQLQQDMWVTVPHLADDNYVQQLAQLIDAELDPNLRVWVEYSNEVWNGIFTQFHYANNELRQQYGTELSPMAAAGRRAAEVFDIFAEEVTAPDRLLRVAAGQAVNPWQLEQLLDGVYTSSSADVASVASYFSLTSEQMDTLYADYLVDDVDLAQVFVDLRQDIDNVSVHWAGNQAVAAGRDLPLVAYEGGQHLVPKPGTQHNDEGFVALLAEINRDPRMGETYQHMIDQWTAIGGETIVFFSDVGNWGKFGYWGLKESLDDTDSPKYNVVQSWLLAEGADRDGDGDVDGADFLSIQRTDPTLIAAWQAEFGSDSQATSSPNMIPEPHVLALLFSGLTALACLRHSARIR